MRVAHRGRGWWAAVLALWWAGRASVCVAQGRWETTAESERAVARGLAWLAANQGTEGNWQSRDLGLVALGAMAFLSAGHAPDRGPYGRNVRLALDYVIANAQPNGLMNISQQDMVNHGLSVFVLTQAYGVSADRRLGPVLDRGVQLISEVQSEDGGWTYKAARQRRGHDLSLAAMQTKALRGAMDIGLDIPQGTIDRAIQSVRSRYRAIGEPDGRRYGDDPLADRPGAFTDDGDQMTVATAASGAVCLQELGQYGDYRVQRSIDYVLDQVRTNMPLKDGRIPFDAYTMYDVGQGLYQVGGERWRTGYPLIRDAIVKTQATSNDSAIDGSWTTERVGGRAGRLAGTAAGVFVLSIPNRYLPILHRGEAEPDIARDAANDAAESVERP